MAARGDLDWEGVRRCAEVEHLEPLLYRQLNGQALLPSEVEEAFREAYVVTSRRNLFVLHELRQALGALRARGVEVIVLKGAALLGTIYDNIALRPLRDVDLLIRQEQVECAVAALGSVGYVEAKVEPFTGAHLLYANELLLQKEGALDIFLDIHWGLFDSPFYQEQLGMDWFWNTTRPATVAGSEVQILGLEGQLLHLCAHLELHHQGRGLMWWVDVAELLYQHGEEVRWEELLEMSVDLDLLISLREVLGRLSAEWGIAAPATFLTTLESLGASQREEQVHAWLARSDRAIARRFWWILVTLPRWQQRLHFVWGQLFPSVLLPLYYPYRWLRGLESVVRQLKGGFFKER